LFHFIKFSCRDTCTPGKPRGGALTETEKTLTIVPGTDGKANDDEAVGMTENLMNERTSSNLIFFFAHLFCCPPSVFDDVSRGTSINNASPD
jgi:hypothetical protein